MLYHLYPNLSGSLLNYHEPPFFRDFFPSQMKGNNWILTVFSLWINLMKPRKQPKEPTSTEAITHQELTHSQGCFSLKNKTNEFFLCFFF